MLLRSMIRCSAFLIAFALSVSGATAQETTLTISAAASLRESIQVLAKTFEKQNPGSHVRINLGGSNLLARQIEAGGPADLFISADERTMQGLQQKKLLVDSSKLNLLGNSLVAVAPRPSTISITKREDLASPELKRIAICEPAVPAGAYAEGYLRKAGLFAALEKRIVRTEDVRSALAAVAGGHADLGWVYKTDAAVSDKVRVVWQAPPGSYDPIAYPVAIVSHSEHQALAAQFLKFLTGAEGRKVFTEAGFTFLPEPAQ